ncbi:MULTISPECIES: HigA family addiction module antitoxin [Burkholderia]|uniref:HigA family addiction module antitoxin n=1 Tax=Burkholderia TaxID=32008 RepID=UPI0008417F71|nr:MULTISPECIES: HigA family addiction module antitoxin [unclassified Burkholderia]
MIITFRPKGLKLFYCGKASHGITVVHPDKLASTLALLDVARTTADVDLPALRIQACQGDLADHWAIGVDNDWQLVFRFYGADIEVVDFRTILPSPPSERIGHRNKRDVSALQQPLHPGHILRIAALEPLHLSVDKAAGGLGVSRHLLARVVKGAANVGADLAIRLEVAGIGSARAWIMLQARYDLSRATRRELNGAALQCLHHRRSDTRHPTVALLAPIKN